MRNSALAMFLVCALAACGCMRPKLPAHKDKPATESTTPERSVLDVDPEEAAREVLDTVPLTGRFRDVKERRALRVGLPPAREPFQFMHPDLGRPAGFNVALAEQIAKVFDAEAQVSFIPHASPGYSWSDDFDIAFQEPGESLCRDAEAIPYFLLPDSRQWLTICVAHDDSSLNQALRNTLAWFVETGMFTYLYTEYFP